MNGLLLVDKPPGCTSHDVVSRVRRALGERRVGHTGTLDPFATGLLALLVGKATRLARYLSGQEKTYSGLVRLGFATETGDREGRPLAPPRPVDVDPVELERVARSLTGPSEQVPPAYSAKKVGGQRAYRLARQGRAPALAPVPVRVASLEAELAGAERIRFTARVSAGTYLRVLAEEMGRRLGAPAHLEELRREAVGELRVAEALPPEQDDPGALREALRPPRDIPLGLPSVRIGEEQARSARHGGLLLLSEAPGAPPGGSVRILGPGGELLAIGEAEPAPGGEGAWRLRPRVVLA
jgi:tRNA pseudouridine55 synthase